jgi:hypothetical protein
VYFYNTISQYGQKITINFNEASDTGSIKVNTVTVTLKATYDGMKGIISSLNQGEYYVKVTGLNATSDVLAEEPSVPASGETGGAALPSATATPAPVQDDKLNITVTLEFYNFGGEIPPDKEYSFTSGASYGGNIFF